MCVGGGGGGGGCTLYVCGGCTCVCGGVYMCVGVDCVCVGGVHVCVWCTCVCVWGGMCGWGVYIHCVWGVHMCVVYMCVHTFSFTGICVCVHRYLGWYGVMCMRVCAFVCVWLFVCMCVQACKIIMGKYVSACQCLCFCPCIPLQKCVHVVVVVGWGGGGRLLPLWWIRMWSSSEYLACCQDGDVKCLNVVFYWVFGLLPGWRCEVSECGLLLSI